ncbi:MAG: hypothetical protein ACR2RD_14270, partial [Woeseiaceae bacterium]
NSCATSVINPAFLAHNPSAFLVHPERNVSENLWWLVRDQNLDFDSPKMAFFKLRIRVRIVPQRWLKQQVLSHFINAEM